ncbi:MAG: glycosyltransferase family 39 protein [Chloroflexota bacterium]
MAIAVLALTIVAFSIRVGGLWGWDGTLTVDEARLALAARGVLATGLPQMPSGWMYTRGLLATYLTAPSFALLGESDFSARLPAVVAGACLIPVAYLLGREVAGRAGGLFVAAFLTGHPSLVVWSRQAWFYAVYLLVLALAVLFIVRAHRTNTRRDQLLAAVLVGLCPFAHEVGIFLVLPLAVQVGLKLRTRGFERRCVLDAVVALAIVGLAGLTQWLLVTHLRASSLVGAYGEIGEYFSPSAEWPRIRFYLRMLLDGPGILLALALIGVPLAVRLRRADTLILWLTALPVLVHAAFFIPRGPQERYGLALVLVVGLLGAQGAVLLAELVAARWRPQAHGGIIAAILIVTLLAHQDVRRAVDRAALSPKEGSWLRQTRELGIGPSDLVMTDIPTTVEWYVGGLDFWISSKDYEKYVSRDGDVRRDVHSGAVLVRNRADFDRLVARPHAGQKIWLIASGRSYQWGELVDDELKAYLDRLAMQRVTPGDNFRILALDARSAP